MFIWVQINEVVVVVVFVEWDPGLLFGQTTGENAFFLTIFDCALIWFLLSSSSHLSQMCHEQLLSWLLKKRRNRNMPGWMEPVLQHEVICQEEQRPGNPVSEQAMRFGLRL